MRITTNAVLLTFGIVALGGGCCPPPSPFKAAPPVDAYSNNLSDSERTEYYYMDEGIHYLPFDMLRALRRPTTVPLFLYDEPFLEEPERLGLARNPLNQKYPPIGISISRDADYVAMAGINCATCHTSVLRYTQDGADHEILVDGGSGYFAVDRFIKELAFSLIATVDPLEFGLFYARYKQFAADRLKSDTSRATWKAEATNEPLAAENEAAQQHEVDELSASPELADFRNAFKTLGERHPDTKAAHARLSSAAHTRHHKPNLRSAKAVAAIAATPTPSALKGSFPTPAELAGPLDVWVYIIDRVGHFLDAAGSAKSPNPATPAGLGRSNPWSVTKNLLASKLKSAHAVPGNGDNAPVNTPHFWGFNQYKGIFLSGVTNSMMERNIAQGVALVTDFDWDKMLTTVSTRKLAQIMTYAEKIQSPKWPSALGTLDATKVAAGKGLFEGKGKCATCHTPTQAADQCPPTEIQQYGEPETDGMYLGVQRQPFGDQGLFPTLASWLATVKKNAYTTENVTAAEQAAFEKGRTPTCWNPPRGLEARPLAGVWASGPYLHNGSVRTLRQLLTPPGQRETQFRVVSYTFDPVDVGFKSEDLDFKVSDYDVPRVMSEQGNSNAGHDFGTDLSDPEKDALIEYMKSL
jgi:hypothetical protein